MAIPGFLKWIGDELLVELIRGVFRGVTSVAADSAKGVVEKRIKPNDRLPQLNADLFDMLESDTEHLRLRLREAKASRYENWLTKLICLAVYDVPGTDPKEMIKVLNAAAADKAQWESFVELLDTDGVIENAQRIAHWFKEVFSSVAEKMRKASLGGVSGDMKRWANRMEKRAKEKKRWL